MMLQEHKLQIVFRAFDDSLESTVLSYVRDRSQLTAASAREKVSQALTAWLAIDALEARRSEFTDDEFAQHLSTAVASLKGRLAYCQSLLERVDNISRETATQSPPVEPISSIALEAPPADTEEEGAGGVDEPNASPSPFAIVADSESELSSFFG